MDERIVLTGPAVEPGGMASIQVNLASGDEWLYVERIGRTTQVWTGPACQRCKVLGLHLRRCELHRKVVLVAQQYRMEDPSR